MSEPSTLIAAVVEKYADELIDFRRDLHAHPELGFEEVYTSGRVVQALKACGVDEILNPGLQLFSF